MNIKEIIFEGYKKHKDILDEYFVQQCKNAKSYTVNMFFNECFDIVNDFNNRIKLSYTDKINYYNKEIEKAKQLNNDYLQEYYSRELSKVDINDFCATAPQGYEVSIKELGYIEKALRKAKEEIIAKKKPSLTFEDLFIEKQNAKRVKELFERNHYTEGGKWAANPDKYSKHTGNKTELLAAYYSLRNKGHILKPGKPTRQARIFYTEFGLKVGEYISERNFTNEPAPHHIEVFNKLFIHIE